MSILPIDEFSASDELADWSGICQPDTSILLEPCGQLVNSDGSFTSDGQRAHDCIQNGILLGGGALALGLPLPLVIPGLKVLSGQTGCDNIVNWDALNSLLQRTNANKGKR